MNSISTIETNDYLISELPNEFSIRCIPYFSCETLSALSRVSKAWNAVVQEELFFYKCELRSTHFDIFRFMMDFPKSKNREEKNLERRILEEIHYDPGHFEMISNSLYSEFLKSMKKLAMIHKNILLILEPFPCLNKFEQYAYSHLLPLKNVISLTDVNIIKRLNIKSIGKKIHTLVLNGTVCRSPIALECLEVVIPQMTKIKTLVWYNIDLCKDNGDNFAFEALSKIIGNIKNLTTLCIDRFKVNDVGSKNLLNLIKNFKKLESLTLEVNEKEGSMNLINDKDIDKIVKKYSRPRIRFILKEEPETKEVYRKITWDLSMK